MAVLAASWLAVTGGAFAAPVTFSGAIGNTITLTGLHGTQWSINNKTGTSSGTPTGTCSNLVPGLSVIDAILVERAGVDKTDPFDSALTLWVNDAQYVSPDTVDVTGETLTSGPVTMSGLDVTVQYYAASTTPVLRALFTFHNPTAAEIDADVKVLSNFGSDALTGARGTSSGDASLSGFVDRWVVTSDDPTTPGDAVVGLAYWGPEAFATFPLYGMRITQTVFDCVSTDGIGAEAPLVVPPGETLSFLFFAQLSATNVEGVTAAATTFGTDSDTFGAPPGNPPVDGDLLAGITRDQLLQVLNWDFFGEVDLTGGGPGGSRWFVGDMGGTSNGLPTGGICERSPGLAVMSATLGSQNRAFDEGLTLWVDSKGFVAPLDSTHTGETFTAGPLTMSDLAVTVQYAAAAHSATLRTLASFTNPTAADITADVVVATNVGSDHTTGIRGTSTGGVDFTPAEHWVVTSDDPTTPVDVVNIHVVSGPNDPPLLPASVSTTVFGCIGPTEGILAEFPVTVPAGQTRRLLFFNGLAPTNEQALMDAAAFDTNPAAGGDLLAGVAPSDLLQVVNWNFCTTEGALCDDGNACTDDPCAAGAGCSHALIARAATFVAVGCRTDALTGDVQSAVPASKIERALARDLGTARAQETKAAMLRAAGKNHGAKRAIAKAIRSLKVFEHVLKSKKATSALSDARRTAFAQSSVDLRADLMALGSTP